MKNGPKWPNLPLDRGALIDRGGGQKRPIIVILPGANQPGVVGIRLQVTA